MSRRFAATYLFCFFVAGMFGHNPPYDNLDLPTPLSTDTLGAMCYACISFMLLLLFLKVKDMEDDVNMKKQRLLRNAQKLQKWDDELDATRSGLDALVGNLEESFLHMREEALQELENEIGDKRGKEMSSLRDMKSALDEMADTLKSRAEKVSRREERLAKEALRLSRIEDAKHLQMLWVDHV